MRELQTRFPKGKVVRDRYIVDELLGQGGFGAVYRVRDRRVKGNVFALKEVVDPNRHQRESFIFEGEVLRRLDHRALPRVYRVFEDNRSRRICMLMDYIDGPNLEQLRLQQFNKRFAVRSVMTLMAPIIEAVIYLHSQEPPIIHRDIKPANIIVPSSGEGAVLVDFGIAKEYDKDSTTTAIRHCSPGYGAPEQYTRDTCTRTDIYGLAATFYTLLTGEVPIEALYRITRMSGRRPDPLHPPHELVPSLPTAMSEVLMHALAVNSNDRFESVEEFWTHLRASAEADVSISMDVVLAQIGSEAHEELCEEETGPLPDDVFFQSPVEMIPVQNVPVTPPLNTHLFESRLSGRHMSVVVYGVVAFCCLSLLVGVAFGVHPYANSVASSGHAQAMLSPTAAVTRDDGSIKVTRKPGTSGGVVVTPTVAPHPSQHVPSVVVPVLASSYEGVIENTPASVGSTVLISQLRQTQNVVSGYLSLGPGLLGSGAFTGTISLNRIQFLVPSYGKLLPLFFQGEVLASGNITGTYCSYLNYQCDYPAGGYGRWDVQPQSLTDELSSS